MRRPPLVPILIVSIAVAPALADPLALAEAGESVLDTGALAEEIDRLGIEIAAPELGDYAERLLPIHQEASEALRSGHPHHALERLQSGLLAADAYSFLIEQRPVTELEGFEKLWRDHADLPEQARLIARAQPCLEAPGQVRALVETAANRAGRHYLAARAMARANTAPSGVFYLGHARAEVHLARLCEVFRLAGPEAADPPTPMLSSLLDERSALEDALDLAYAVPGAAIDRHSEFIALSAALKEIAELGDAGMVFGALDRLLDATLHLSLLETSSSQTATADDLRGRLESSRALLSSDGKDHSIAVAYLERAMAAIDDPQADDKHRLGAEHVVTRVLPSYLMWVGLTQP